MTLQNFIILIDFQYIAHMDNAISSPSIRKHILKFRLG